MKKFILLLIVSFMQYCALAFKSKTGLNTESQTDSQVATSAQSGTNWDYYGDDKGNL